MKQKSWFCELTSELKSTKLNDFFKLNSKLITPSFHSKANAEIWRSHPTVKRYYSESGSDSGIQVPPWTFWPSVPLSGPFFCLSHTGSLQSPPGAINQSLTRQALNRTPFLLFYTLSAVLLPRLLVKN